MNKMRVFAKKLYLRCKGFISQDLPTSGMKELDQYCEMIFFTYNLPDLPSYRQAICSMIMHLSPTVHAKAPYFFAKSVKKAMANQIAYEKIQKLKKDEDEYIKKTLHTSRVSDVENL